MTKEEFLKLSALCWDYNRRHAGKRMLLSETLDLERLSIAYFEDYPEIKCVRTFSTGWDMAEIMEELRS
jgi:hypothetical protein